MRKVRVLVIFLCILAPWFSEPAAGQQPAKRKGHAAAAPAPVASKPTLDGFDEWVGRAMKDWKVPGLAIAVVQDGKVILSKGYGLRDVKSNLPVTSSTLFAIGSITKSFTVSALGMLADDGKLDWDKPVREYMPGFRMYDEIATDHMTPRDLVTHRSGLPRHDAVWYNTTFTRKEMVDRLRYLEPSKDFRSTFQYNNLMFLTAGVLAQHISGMKWEDLVRQRILEPLGMNGSNFSVDDSQKARDFAKPYGNAKDNVVEIPFRGINEIAPAGAINSSADDMARYLLFHLGHGKFGDKQLLSEGNEIQMQTPQMVIQSQPRYPELGFNAYGMGIGVTTYRGHRLVTHSGGIDGFTAQLGFLPQDNIGVIVLTNLSADKNHLIVDAEYNVFDRLLGLEQIDWSGRDLMDMRKAEAAEAEAEKQGLTGQKTGTHPSHDLAEYLGEYENAGYGRLQVEAGKDAGTLALTYNRMSTPLWHFHYDVFAAPADPLNPFEKMKVRFTTDLKGDIDSVLVPLEPNVKEIVFSRVAERRMREKSFLEPLAGQYQLGAVKVTIALKGENTLVMVIAGQPERALAPVRGTTFDLQGLSGFSLEFKKDASGEVTEFVSYQPDGTYVAKRKR